MLLGQELLPYWETAGRLKEPTSVGASGAYNRILRGSMRLPVFSVSTITLTGQSSTSPTCCSERLTLPLERVLHPRRRRLDEAAQFGL
jgi:hypothetical protein